MRYTVEEEICFSGTGLHSGRTCRTSVLPFDRPGVWICAHGEPERLSPALIGGADRRTGLTLGDGTVQTCEHLLAALWCLHIDGVLIRAADGEVPIMDGSARSFADRIMECRVPARFGPESRAFAPSVPIVADDVPRGRFMGAFPSDVLRITAVIDYSGTPIGVVRRTFEITEEVFMSSISGARTFCLTSELEGMQSRGLIKGGSLENALVVGEEGPLNGRAEWDFADECVCHKVLDILGDMAILGCPVKAHVVAIASGHELHHILVNRISGFLK